jgi:hypothetical protein
MPVKRHIWNEPLTKSHVPGWHCPACDGGYLKHNPGSLHFLETSTSLSGHGHEAWEPEWTEYRFTTLLICNNEQCREPVSVMGHGRLEINQLDWNGEVDVKEFFFPEYVSPSPPLITLSDEYPEPVVDELRKAFVSSWSDYGSAGNHIRSAIERLLDFLKEPKLTKLRQEKTGKRERLTLHARIKNLGLRDKELSDSLLAVKWLGNAGSHSNNLSRKDIFDALDILDLNLNDLFIRHRARVKKLVTVINKHKGPSKK